MRDVLIKIGLAVALIVALFTFKHWYDKSHFDAGFNAAKLEYEAREMTITTQAQTELAQKNADALQRERGLIEYYDQVATLRNRDLQNYEKTISDLRATHSFGLRADVTRNPLYRTEPGTNTGITAGLSATERAELMPGTVDAILRIAVRSARDVRDYNDLLDLYNKARLECNKPP